MTAWRLAVLVASLLGFAFEARAAAPDPRTAPAFEIYNSGFVTYEA